VLQLCGANRPEPGALVRARPSIPGVVNTRAVAQRKAPRSKADIRRDLRTCIQGAVRTQQTQEAIRIQEGAGNKLHWENTCGHMGRDGNPVGKHRESRIR
jgi:hypothetical protein